MTAAIAMDLGGTHCSIAVVQDRRLLAVNDVALDALEGLGPLLPRLREETLALLRGCSLQTLDCLGVSLSLPSLVDFRQGRVVSANDKYPDAVTTDLRAWSEQAFQLPIAIENDARAALMGEHVCGAAEGAADVLMLTLGTGIGSAVLVGGKPFRTAQAQGGNLGGHIPVSLNGRRCTCGAIGCMEAEASSWALPQVVAAWPAIETSRLAGVRPLDFRGLFACANDGDPVAREIVRHCVHVWAVGVVGLVHAYGPELVVLGGGVMQNAAAILPELRAYVHRHAWMPSGAVRIEAATLGNHAPLYAAVPLLEDFLGAVSRVR